MLTSLKFSESQSELWISVFIGQRSGSFARGNAMLATRKQRLSEEMSHDQG